MDIVYQDVNFSYYGINQTAKSVLKQLNMAIPYHQMTAIIGKTGSGKTTLTKLLNGLEKPHSGKVVFKDSVLTPESSQDEQFLLKKHVGMVFQFPETQLFEKTVLDDVMFGPLNFGYAQEEAKKMAIHALSQVGIDDQFYGQNPLRLSGGQMRKVAIAGVLACDVDVLVLDEPTAGLDSTAKKDLMNLFKTLNETEQKTIVFISHDMNEVSEYADYVAVIQDGACVKLDTTANVFYDDAYSDIDGVVLPETVHFFKKLLERVPNSKKFEALKPVTVKALMSSIEMMKQEETQSNE
ncbi:energy-coupling factor transporter ATPase [Carnobacteriaceae bacterium zg-ZUI252]|nr:energy-coupling factor transporter ATPase [Carnobacteriaceae bacterium zg-ZUI252]QTU82414.1 energy-coupling factor transporter ATPase [Carnobacteriaceae bacterium zg-C25]